MGHIELAAPVTHIWYFKGVPSRLGLPPEHGSEGSRKGHLLRRLHASSTSTSSVVTVSSRARSSRRNSALLVRGVQAARGMEARARLRCSRSPSVHGKNWIEKQFAKSLEQNRGLKEKDQKRQPRLCSDDRRSRGACVAFDESKKIKSSHAHLKKKIASVGMHLERPANLHKEQIHGDVPKLEVGGRCLPNDVIFDRLRLLLLRSTTWVLRRPLPSSPGGLRPWRVLRLRSFVPRSRTTKGSAQDPGHQASQGCQQR